MPTEPEVEAAALAICQQPDTCTNDRRLCCVAVAKTALEAAGRVRADSQAAEITRLRAEIDTLRRARGALAVHMTPAQPQENGPFALNNPPNP